MNNSATKLKKSFSLLVMGFSLYLLGAYTPALCLTFSISTESDIVGEIQMATVQEGQSLGDIGRQYDVGVCEMIEANPNLDPWVPIVGTTVIIPTQFILPPGDRVGIVLNLSELRLYFYHPDKKSVTTFPLGLGKRGWSTPLGLTKIVSKEKDPSWTPPVSIRQEHLKKGDVLPAVVPPGPDNPLGRYKFRLGFSGFLMHGTNREGGIGVRSTHGCIRLFPADIEALYALVPVGTPVRIIHEPFKVGEQNGKVYLEVHQPITEAHFQNSNSDENLNKVIANSLKQPHLVNWTSAKQAAMAANGYPVRID
jgi:L,D-transpeptidase ErfK/SrfK